MEYKQKMVKDLLERIAKLEKPEINPVIGSKYPFSYRNKAQFPLTTNREGEIVTGFYKQGSHQVVVHNNCQIQHPLINRIINETIVILNEYKFSVYNEELHKGVLRYLLVRVGICTNQALLTIVTSQSKLPTGHEIARRIREAVPEIVGVLQNINQNKTNVIIGGKTKVLSGQDFYIDFIGDIKYAISAPSFFQVNTLQTNVLYDLVVQFASFTGNELVVDAYCGIGSISLYLAKKVKRVIGIEEVQEAINDAEKNAAINNINNCTFITGKVEEELPLLMRQGIKPDLLVFDPPRKGLDQGVIKAVLKTKPAKIIYVSCNPATLARDLAIFKDKYTIQKVQAVDMFPNTYHIENVVLMEVE